MYHRVIRGVFMRAIAIDFETANESRASPCAVGLAWIEDGVVTRRAYSLVRPPEMRFSSRNIDIHGIRPRDVETAPDLPTLLGPLLDDLAGSTILAHNAGFDIGVLCGTFAAYRLPVPRLTYLCTKVIARCAWPGEPRYGLAALSARIGLQFQHHHAGEDAFACARIALAAAETVGTGRMSVMARTLGIRKGVAEGDMRTPCMSAGLRRDEAERRFRRPAAPPPAGRLGFTMRGSQGASYEIVGSFAGEGYGLRCSCMAGRHRLRCRHVTALLDGDIGDLLSDNLHDVEKLRAVVQALGEEAIEPPASRIRLSAA